MPKFKKKTTSRRKKPLNVREKKPYTPFPPPQQPSKIDLQIESGEYFLNEQQRELMKKMRKKELSKLKSDYQDGDNISNDNKRNRKSSKKETKSNKKTKH